MTAIQPLTLVLWGQGFNEIAASIFVAELRNLGKRVKLVGLNHKYITGQHGVTLVPDLSLGQALRSANALQCLIIPASLAALQQFSYDPRMAELLEIVSNRHVLVVADSHLPTAQTGVEPAQQPPIVAPSLLLSYPASEELTLFVKTTLLSRLA